jgi:NADPH:quinone reductase-like Zn-dependent oxidoreductase
MKIVQFERFGPAHEVCACVEAADPGPPGPGEVAVKVEAFPINPVDLLTIAGVYAERLELPAVPGSEGVGVVEAAGPGVKSVAPGDRVLLMGRGNWVERQRVKEQMVARVPLAPGREVDVLQLAMLKINPATAALMIRRYGNLKAGDWLIQNAANSGVGRFLIALAKAAGIRTVNVVRRRELVKPLTDIGADAVLLDGDDLAARAKAAAGGQPIRLGIDAIAGPATMRLSECLADGATLVNYGRLSDEPCMISPNRVIFGGVTLTGFWLLPHLVGMTAADRAGLYTELAGRMAAGELKSQVEAVYPIADIKQALAHAAKQGRGGKILVKP